MLHKKYAMLVRTWSLGAILILSSNGFSHAASVDVKPLLAKLRAVGAKGEGHRDAIAAWQALSQADGSQLTEVLTGLDGDCGPLAANWVRSAAEAIAGKVVKSGGQLPISSLEKFLADTSHSPKARRLAYELILSVDKTAEQRLIPGLINDPSLELRRDAVALAMARAADSETKKADKAKIIGLYQTAFDASRDIDQIKANADKLKGLGEKPETAKHMGFIMKWHLIAPFDNVDMKGFDVAYPPEQGIDLSATYPGKSKNVSWIATATDDSYGMVDLNKTLDKYKGAIAYAFAEFNSPREQDVELRYGSYNATKLWLNGQLLATNEIYHAGQEIDQYVGRGRLKKGRNEILLKVAQNEQTENWAQDWQFQLRVCDSIGTAVLAVDRADSKTALLK